MAKVSVKQHIDIIIADFKKEFDALDEIETPIEDISSISCLEEISSAIGELLRSLNDTDEEITVKLEQLDEFEGEEDDNE